MSNSKQRTSLPTRLEIPDKCLENQDQMVKIALDMRELLQCWRTTISDISTYPKSNVDGVRILWREAAFNMYAMYDCWAYPIVTQLADSQARLSGPLRTSILDRYGFAKDVDYTKVIRSLANGLQEFERALIYWTLDLNIHGMDITSESATIRPVTEILVEALLLTLKRDTGSPKHSLRDLDTARKPAWMHEKEWNAIVKLKALANARPVGYPACISALWVSHRFYTGSTLIKWGMMGEFDTGMKEEDGQKLTLHEWFRRERQKRFGAEEQRLINRLVIREMAYFVQERAKASEDIYEDDPRKAATATLVKSADDRRVATLRTFFQHQNRRAEADLIGQAYEGKSLLPKRKCPFCTNIYRFPVIEGDLPNQVQNGDSEWLRNVGEIDRVPPGCHRGCCAEALVFVRWVVANGNLDEVMNALSKEKAEKQLALVERTFKSLKEESRAIARARASNAQSSPSSTSKSILPDRSKQTGGGAQKQIGSQSTPSGNSNREEFWFPVEQFIHGARAPRDDKRRNNDRSHILIRIPRSLPTRRNESRDAYHDLLSEEMARVQDQMAELRGCREDIKQRAQAFVQLVNNYLRRHS